MIDIKKRKFLEKFRISENSLCQVIVHMGALKMREWKMQERQSMESHKKKYSKAPDEIWLSWLSCVVLAKRNSQASRPVNAATNHRQCVRYQQSYPRSGHQTRHETC